MGGCAGWSVPLLFSSKNIQIFSRRGPFHYRLFCSLHCFTWFQSPVGFVTYHQRFCIFLNHNIASFTRSPKRHCQILYPRIRYAYETWTALYRHSGTVGFSLGLRLAIVQTVDFFFLNQHIILRRNYPL